MEWTAPGTRDELRRLAVQGMKHVLLVPISFICENLETLYDLDCDIIPYAVDTLLIPRVKRLHFDGPDRQVSDKLMIEALAFTCFQAG